MRRLLSSAAMYTSRRRGRTPVAIHAAPAAFSRFSLRPIVGVGRNCSNAPARLFRFLEVNDGNHSWYANRD
jgi:hypothetical protein